MGVRFGDVYNALLAGAKSTMKPVHLPRSGTQPTARQVAQNEKAHAIGCAAEVNAHSSWSDMLNECQESKTMAQECQEANSNIKRASSRGPISKKYGENKFSE